MVNIGGSIVIKRLKAIAATACIAAAAALPGQTLAQNFPSEPVQLIVPFPPGGGTDILGRIVAQKLSEIWGQPVVVENRPGAAGAIGTTEGIRAEPNGYTILMASTGSILALADEATADGKFEITNILQPISLVSAPPYIVALHPSVEADSVDELIAFAKENPGRVPYGSSGFGSASHLTGALFEQMAGVELLHIPYGGTGEALTDLLSGEISVMFGPAPTLNTHVEAGSLRAIAVTSLNRSKLFPDLPSVSEAGVEGFESVGWFGLFVPRETPDEIVAEISRAVLEALQSEGVREQMAAQSAEPAGMEPEAYTAWVNEDIGKWLSIMKTAEQK